MNGVLLAGIGSFGWSVANIAIAVVVIAAVIALVYVALKKFNVAVPDWIISVFWIVVVAVVIIGAIKLVLSMW